MVASSVTAIVMLKLFSSTTGVLKSFVTHNFRADTENYRFTLDQTINYNECAYRPLTDLDVIRIGVTRNFVVYAGTEQIVRFSQTNKVVAAAGEFHQHQ